VLAVKFGAEAPKENMAGAVPEAAADSPEPAAKPAIDDMNGEEAALNIKGLEDVSFAPIKPSLDEVGCAIEAV
jgi:hypothetical protein